MPSKYYKPCEELTRCVKLDPYWEKKEFEKWFEGYLEIATDTHYALAECQVGYAYLEGIGITQDLHKAFEWTKQSAIHGDRDGQFNLAYMFENGIGVEKDIEKAQFWYQEAALQDHDLAINKCKEYHIL